MNRENNFPPAAINIVLHYHCSPVAYSPDSRVKSEWEEFFEKEGILVRNGGYFDTTEKGKKFVEMITSTPLPENIWTDPRFNTIGDSNPSNT